MTRWLTLAFVTAFTVSCRSGPPETTGDEVRTAAVDLPVGRTVDDKVCDDTDPVDWKRFTVPSERSPVKISIYWDNPKIEAVLRIVSYYGVKMAEVEHKEGAGMEQWQGELNQGTYFVEIRAKDECSVYTVELLVGDIVSNPYGVPRPE